MVTDASIYGSSCIACGGKAEKRARVAASSCSTLLKSYLSRRCQDNATEVDLDAVIKASYMCRSCHNSYKSHQQKDDHLFEATGSSFDYVVKFGSEMMSSVDCTVTPVTRNRPPSQSVASRKRSRTLSCKEQTSPSVTVSKLMYSCYIIFVFIGRN